jgi:hypothetical protein
MYRATPFPGVLKFFTRCKEKGIPTFIISHKTQHPIIGPSHDLHESAHEWLSAAGFYDHDRGGLSPRQVYFDLTKEAKLDRIATLHCTHFIDDLPEFLSEESFPAGVRKVLFDPNDTAANNEQGFVRALSWQEIEGMFID